MLIRRYQPSRQACCPAHFHFHNELRGGSNWASPELLTAIRGAGCDRPLFQKHGHIQSVRKREIPKNVLAIPGRLELPTYGLGNRRSIRLSYGTGCHSHPHVAVICPAYQSQRPIATPLLLARAVIPLSSRPNAGKETFTSSHRVKAKISQHDSTRDECAPLAENTNDPTGADLSASHWRTLVLALRLRAARCVTCSQPIFRIKSPEQKARHQLINALLSLLRSDSHIGSRHDRILRSRAFC